MNVLCFYASNLLYMKKLYVLVLLLSTIFASYGQVSVTATGGGSNSYNTLKKAFDAINAGTFTGAVTITLTGSTSETNTAQLNASGGTVNYSSVTINVTAASIVSYSKNSPLILFNGADNVTINGNNLLTLVNTNTAGNTISFAGDALGNTINKTLIRGGTVSGTSGVVYFGAGTTTGNDNNTLDSCSVDGMGSAVYCINSTGNITSSATENSGDTIRNCKVYNNQQGTGNTAGIFLNYGSTDWYVYGNSIYQTAAVSAAAEGVYYGIQALPAFTTDANRIINNYIGGNAPLAAGMFSVTGTGAQHLVGFKGIDMECGGPNSITTGNTIKNVAITFTFSDSSVQNAGIFAYLYGFNGNSVISGNTISNLTVTNTAGLASIQGISATGEVTTITTVTHSFNIDHNIISNLAGASAGTGNVNVMGIRLNCHSADNIDNTATLHTIFTVDSNAISNLSAPMANNNTWARGISNLNTQGINSNANLLPRFNIYSNIINTLASSSTTASYNQGAVEGIKLVGGTVANTTDYQIVAGNLIYGLAATQTADFNTTAIGIFATDGLYAIIANRIYGISNAIVPVTTHPGIVGVLLKSSQSASTIADNFISLGDGVSSNVHIFGIMNPAVGDGLNVYYNSVVVEGTGSGGNTLGTSAFLRGTQTFSPILTPTDVKDNIFQNLRTGGTGDNYAMAMPGTSLYLSNYNDFFTANPATLVLYGASAYNFLNYKTTSGQDLNSLSVLVSFNNPLVADLHLTGTSQVDMKAGTPITNVPFDYDGEIRDIVLTFLGADEITVPQPVTLLNLSGKKDSGVNLLTWTTSQELNSSYFEVQRSGDGRNFKALGKVTAAGNSSAERTYHFADANASGDSYYRLRMVDINGSYKYSSVVKIASSTTISVNFYPNPVQDQLQVSLNTDKTGTAEVMISNNNGQVVYRSTRSVNDGSNVFNIPVSRLAKGNYVITVVNGAEKTVQQFIKL
jgi:hypothetical protein